MSDFLALKDCPLDREGYIAILKAKGLIVGKDDNAISR